MQRTEPRTNPSFRSLAPSLSMAFEAMQVSSFRSMSKSLFEKLDLDFKILAPPRDPSQLSRRFVAPISALIPFQPFASRNVLGCEALAAAADDVQGAPDWDRAACQPAMGQIAAAPLGSSTSSSLNTRIPRPTTASRERRSTLRFHVGRFQWFHTTYCISRTVAQ